jgi:DNA-nicking Smr family endonuclease
MSDDPDADAEVPHLPMDGVLDLHTFAPRDVADLVPTWLDACHEHGLYELRIVHGKGQGVLQRTVHAILSRRSDIQSYRLAPPERGGWGATLVTLKRHE